MSLFVPEYTLQDERLGFASRGSDADEGRRAI